MRKLKLKSIITIFAILLVVQLLMVIADVTLTKNGSGLVSITDPIVELFSLPISLINKNLPFYVRESLPIKVLYWIMNVFIQASVIYIGWRVFKRVKKKLK